MLCLLFVVFSFFYLPFFSFFCAPSLPVRMTGTHNVLQLHDVLIFAWGEVSTRRIGYPSAIRHGGARLEERKRRWAWVGGWGMGRDEWCIWHPTTIKEASVRIVPSDVDLSSDVSAGQRKVVWDSVLVFTPLRSCESFVWLVSDGPAGIAH